jgi:two-component system, cell cycle sensor histidine kinase and response regulator CckA
MLGMKTILILEDQDANLAAFCMVLKMNGYDVLPAKDEDAAIRLSQEHQGSIDLLVADVILPRASGARIAQQIMKMCHMPVLFVSGLSCREVQQQGFLHPSMFHAGTAFLIEKPFTVGSLLNTVDEILSHGSVSQVTAL